MDKKIFILIGLALVVIIVGVVIFLKKGDSSSKEIELTYKIASGIPFEWQYEIEDPSVVAFVRSYALPNDNNKKAISGGNVETNYVFKGLKKGKTTVTFKYVYLEDGSVDMEEKTTFLVDSDLNISILGIDE